MTSDKGPEFGSPQDRAAWYRLNASPEERLAITAHELGHYEMAKRAGVDPEGITIGHHPTDGRSGSRLFGGCIDTGLTHSIDQWAQKAQSITGGEVEHKRFLKTYLKSLYAGEIAEELITQRASNSGVVDSELARNWMRRLGFSDHEMNQQEIDLKQQVRKELSEPETKRKLTYAAQQLAEHHFDGQMHPSSTIDHYLSGGAREDLPRRNSDTQH
jgi:hypothetical protein